MGGVTVYGSGFTPTAGQDYRAYMLAGSAAALTINSVGGAGTSLTFSSLIVKPVQNPSIIWDTDTGQTAQLNISLPDATAGYVYQHLKQTAYASRVEIPKRHRRLSHARQRDALYELAHHGHGIRHMGRPQGHCDRVLVRDEQRLTDAAIGGRYETASFLDPYPSRPCRPGVAELLTMFRPRARTRRPTTHGPKQPRRPRRSSASIPPEGRTRSMSTGCSIPSR